MSRIEEEMWNGITSFVIENDYVLLRVLPEFGGKIVEISDLGNGYQWLWQDESRPFRKRTFGDSYDKYDISGFDECFPNIGVSKHPELEETLLPDHGELWTKPWDFFSEGDNLVGEVHGHLFNYLFRRTIALNMNSIHFEYEVENMSEVAFSGFWSAHPLFKAEEEMSIEITGHPQMTKEFSFSSRMGSDGEDGYAGHLDNYFWPTTQGENLEMNDLSKINLTKVLTDKVVVKVPEDGKITLNNPRFGCSLKLRFDPRVIPYVGVCFNLGAYPWVGSPGTWIALEPATGPTDRLDECWNLSDLPTFKGKSRSKFGFVITLDNEKVI